MNQKFDELTKGPVQPDSQRGSTVVQRSSNFAFRLLMPARVQAGTVTHAAALYAWTTDTSSAVFLEVPPGGSLGNNPVTLPDDATVKAPVRAADLCDPVVIEVTHVDGGSFPQFNRIFTITATDRCLTDQNGPVH